MAWRWQLMVADYRDFYKGMDDPVTLPTPAAIVPTAAEPGKQNAGEYVLRLVLDRFRRNGELVSKVKRRGGRVGRRG